MKIDFDDNMKISKISNYPKNMMGIAVAKNTLFVSYENKIAKVNLLNGKLYDEFQIKSLNTIYGAAQGGYITPIVSTISINGPNDIDVPTKNLSPQKTDYKAIIKDQFGHIIDNAKVSWSLKKEVNGVEINESTGELTITNKTNSGSITIVAECDTIEQEKEITINKAQSQISNIEIIGRDTVDVPLQNTPYNIYTYDVKMEDQYGNSIDYNDIIWSLQATVDGISIDSEGKLKVTSEAPYSLITIEVKVNSIKANKTIKLDKIPPIKINDELNILQGADETMEYSIDGGTTWNDYNNELSFPGKVTVQVRYKETELLEASEITEVIFTKNTPEAPNVSGNDEENTLQGADETMEYSIDDGTTWDDYNNDLIFQGKVTVQLRYKETELLTASKVVKVEFTKNTPEAPNVSGNDEENTLQGADETMEYLIDDGTTWNDYNNELSFPGKVTVQIRYKETELLEASEITEVIFTKNTPEAPNVSGNDEENTLQGADETMEYSIDDGTTWDDYNNDLIFQGKVTVQVRYKETELLKASKMTEVIFTKNTPEAPNVSGNDEENTLKGADETMEYSIDGGTTWNDYNNELSFPGKVTVQVRYKETELLEASEITEVIFTKNTPEAPNVSGNDEANTLQGADETMEYSIDGGTTWNDYNNELIFQGKVTVQLRYKETELLEASEITEVIFTKNTPEAPNVSGNDEENTLQGADETMEYSIDDGTTWDDYNNDLIFQGKVTVQVRYKETELLEASEITEVIFTKNTPEAPNVSGNDEENTLKGADETMEYSIDNGTTWNDYNNDLIFQGKVTVQVRYKETELLKASKMTEVIFTKNTPEAPNVSGNDEENTLQGADETMEYSIDNGTTWNDYNNELSFPGKVTVQIRYKETELLTASEITEVIFTKNTPEAPNVSGDDEENTLQGADETMEYSIDDGTTWDDYNNDLIFQGKVTVQVRYKETELLEASEITEVIFTKNTPEAPNVSGNDEENTLKGADETMEYSIDNGTTWNDYNNELSFPGKVTVQIRYKETELLEASEITEVIFTKNTPEAPNVSGNDEENTLQGADETMEYSIDNGTTWNDYNNELSFPGKVTVQIRYKETELLEASEITEVIFTKNTPEAPNVSGNDEENTLQGADETMEYSIDNGTTWNDYNNELTFSGKVIVQIRYKETELLTASEITEVIFTKNTPEAPNVSGNDEENTLKGADETMEYSIDNGTTWNDYNNDLIFQGKVTVQIRYKETELLTASEITEVIFTKNTQEAPNVSGNDEANTLQGADETMEYSIDGGTTWNDYNNALIVPGKVTVQLRYKETELLTASEVVKVEFTKNTPEAPNVSSNDKYNTLQGADDTMEYSFNGGSTWYTYRDGKEFPGNETVQVRYKETELLTASKITEVIFTKNSSSSGGNHKKPSKENDKNHNKPSKKDETDLEDELIIEEPLTPLGAIEYYEPYIKGFPDGSFKPSKSVTRAEVATMFARILSLDTKDTNNCKYVDVSSDYWAKKYIKAVTDIGLFTGDTDNTFRPNEPIKRYEIAIVFSRYWDYVGVTVKDSKSIFKDTSGHWAESYINKLYNAGVVTGFTDKTFRPDTDTVREQIVVMINKIIARPSLETEEPLFTDIINEHWAFGDIQAASVKFNKKESEEKTEK